MTSPTQRARFKQRRDEARAAGLCQWCHVNPGRNDNGVIRSRCESCHAKQQAQAQLASYLPWDVLLERPSIRILRALLWFDGVTASDLMDAIDGARDHESRVRGRYRQSLFDLADAGYIAGAAWDLYRITPAGRAWLAKQLARAEVGVEEAA